MEAIIPIVERLGSLGILVLMVWRAPSIIGAISTLIDTVSSRLAAVQDKVLAAYKEQQQSERDLVTLRFEQVDKALEKLVSGLDTTMKSQATLINGINQVCHDQEDIRHRLERLEEKK
jgi:paraquat-inducible protein B